MKINKLLRKLKFLKDSYLRGNDIILVCNSTKKENNFTRDISKIINTMGGVSLLITKGNGQMEQSLDMESIKVKMIKISLRMKEVGKMIDLMDLEQETFQFLTHLTLLNKIMSNVMQK